MQFVTPVRRLSQTIVPAAFACLCLAVVLSTVSNVCAQRKLPASDAAAWPGFLGPHRDGISAETSIRTDWSGGKLPLLWQLDSGEGYGIGSASGGRYYHFDSTGDQARLRCLNARTGQEVWTFGYQCDYEDMYGYDSGPRTSPLIDGDRVYVYGVGGKLICLECETGKEVWSCDTVKRFGVVQNFFGVGSSPAIFGDRLLVMVGGSPEESQSVPPGALDRVKSNGSGVVAFDKLTGEVRYQTIDDLASYSSIRVVKRGDQAIAYAWMRDRLYAFDPATGKQQFEFPWRSRKLESVNAMTPVVDERGSVFLSDCYEKGSVLFRIDRDRQPEIIWSDDRQRKKALQVHWNTPVLLDGHLYGCSGRNSSEAELRCVQLKTGKVMWRQPGLNRTTVTAVAGHLIVLGERGELRLVRATAKAYEEVTRWVPGKSKVESGRAPSLDYPAWAAPIVADGLMFVRGKKQLLCFELKAE